MNRALEQAMNRCYCTPGPPYPSPAWLAIQQTCRSYS